MTVDQPTPVHSDRIDSLLEAGTTEAQGLLTGFSDLDLLTRGLAPGSLTVIASRPGMGRTTLLTNLCRFAAVAQGAPTLVYTLEETKQEFTQRTLAAEGRIAWHYLRRGELSERDSENLARCMPRLEKAPLFIKAPGRVDMATMAREAQEMVSDHGVMMLAVDGIQDVRPPRRNDLREREVGDVVRDLKTLARELNLAVVATAHLNRGPEGRLDKLPRLDDLRESGAITFAADTIILLHREDYYDLDSPRAGEADFFVAKHRQGPTARVTVAFQGHYGRFVDMAPSD